MTRWNHLSNKAQVRILLRVVAALLEQHPERAVRVSLADLRDMRASLGLAIEGDKVVIALGDKR